MYVIYYILLYGKKILGRFDKILIMLVDNNVLKIMDFITNLKC